MRLESSNELIDFGFVGDIDAIDSRVIRKHLDDGLMPVISPLSADAKGTLLNINADTVAAAIGAALAPGRDDPTTNPHMKYADTNGIRVAYYEVGPREGVPVIFCHGFPELAFSWRHQLAAFQKAGRWAIAPDQRGYGLTSRPDKVEAYDLGRGKTIAD